jgi:hypothetical protein
MPEIELPPGKYRWRRPLSKPLAWAYVALGVGMLGFIYFTWSPARVNFFATAFVAFCLGLIVAGILRDVD